MAAIQRKFQYAADRRKTTGIHAVNTGRPPVTNMKEDRMPEKPMIQGGMLQTPMNGGRNPGTAGVLPGKEEDPAV